MNANNKQKEHSELFMTFDIITETEIIHIV